MYDMAWFNWQPQLFKGSEGPGSQGLAVARAGPKMPLTEIVYLFDAHAPEGLWLAAA